MAPVTVHGAGTSVLRVPSGCVHGTPVVPSSGTYCALDFQDPLLIPSTASSPPAPGVPKVHTSTLVSDERVEYLGCGDSLNWMQMSKLKSHLLNVYSSSCVNYVPIKLFKKWCQFLDSKERQLGRQEDGKGGAEDARGGQWGCHPWKG